MEDLVLSCLESRVEENRNLYARFLVGPFFKGDALTVATALRRVLLSSVESVAITALYIQGITHEFSSIVGVRESVLELSLNFQSIVLCYDKRFFQKKDFFDDVQIGYLQVQGPKVVYANDLKLPLGVKVVDPTQYIATISREGVIVLKFTLGKITNSSNQHSSFHASLPATKQAIRQQLLKRNIVKAKTRCSYKKNYAVNPNLYCYPSIKRIVRALSSTAQLIGEPRSRCSAKQSFAKPLGFANFMPFGYAQKPKVYTYKPKEQNARVKASENGASRIFAVKDVNKAKSFSNVNCSAQRENLSRPFCKKKRFQENGSNHFVSNTRFCPQSFFFYNVNNTKCKLIKPIKKKGYTKHTSLLANPTFDRDAYKSICVALAEGHQVQGQNPVLQVDLQENLYPMPMPMPFGQGQGQGQGQGGRSYKTSCKAKRLAMQNKALFRSVMRSPKVLQTQIKNKNDESMPMHLVQRQRQTKPLALTSPSVMHLRWSASAKRRFAYKSKRAKLDFVPLVPKICMPYKAKLCIPEMIKCKSSICTPNKSSICTPCKPTPSVALQNSHRKFTFAGDKRQRMQRSNDSKSNHGFNKTGNHFRLIENVFQSDICLHNIIPLDASLSPVLKVNFLVEIDDEVLYLRQKVRERIILEVWTNGSIHPRQALHDATLSLLDIFSTFRSIYQTNEYSSTLLKVPEYNKR